MKENEIRPQSIFDEYLNLCEQDIETYFAQAPRYATPCPACGEAGEFAFHKKGFSYETCPACLTLFVSPRPEKPSFDSYYTDSPSTRYWATTFYRETEEARREKLWKPKAQLVAEKVARFGGADVIIDVGGGYGTFGEEIRNLGFAGITVIEPSVHLAEVCRSKGLATIQRFLEDITPQEIAGNSRCFVSFELFEHLHDPSTFLKAIRNLMGPDDLFIFTTLSGTGIDIQVLWEHSKSVSPPHHLNFFNPHSVNLLLQAEGFHLEEVTTPGKLDLDIMKNNIEHVRDRFWRTFLTRASEEERQKMQNFIADNLLSSHMMVVCRRAP